MNAKPRLPDMLGKHRAEELLLLEKLRAEARLPSALG